MIVQTISRIKICMKYSSACLLGYNSEINSQIVCQEYYRYSCHYKWASLFHNVAAEKNSVELVAHHGNITFDFKGFSTGCKKGNLKGSQGIR